MNSETFSPVLRGTKTGFSAQVHAGDVLHIWQKPVNSGSASQVLIREATGETHILSGPPSDDFQMTPYSVVATGEVTLTWHNVETLVSVGYAYSPVSVLEEGVRLLWVVSDAAPEAERFQLHLAPPFGWMNDPNGLITIDGHTHAFYQHYPNALHWDTMHWGHAVSHNLVDWTHLPVFMHPRQVLLADPAKQGGAYSGSAIPGPQGGLRIFHTDREDNRQPIPEWQMTTTSVDGITAAPATPIIEDYPSLAGFGDFLRDPYVFMGPDGLWKMVLAGKDDTAALVLLYETTDPDAANGWSFVGVLHREILPGNIRAECPCVLPLDGDGDGLYVLIFGLLGNHKLIEGRYNPSFAVVGHFDGRVFQEITRRELDFIGDCYAFQGYLHEGRPVGMAWAANWIDVRRSENYTSSMTFMRRLVWQNGSLLMPPIESVADLRTKTLTVSTADLLEGVVLPTGLAEISLETGNAPFRLSFSHDDGPVTLVHDGKTLELLGEWPARGRPVPKMAETGALSSVRIFIDVGLIEIYADGGLWCGTKRFDSNKPFTEVQLLGDAGMITTTEIWELRPQHGALRSGCSGTPIVGNK